MTWKSGKNVGGWMGFGKSCQFRSTAHYRSNDFREWMICVESANMMPAKNTAESWVTWAEPEPRTLIPAANDSYRLRSQRYPTHVKQYKLKLLPRHCVEAERESGTKSETEK